MNKNTKKSSKVESIEPTIESVESVESVEPTTTIFDKYRVYINQSKSGYLKGLNYPQMMEILRYSEKILNRSIPINTSCGTCILDLVKLFSNLEKNK